MVMAGSWTSELDAFVVFLSMNLIRNIIIQSPSHLVKVDKFCIETVGLITLKSANVISILEKMCVV